MYHKKASATMIYYTETYKCPHCNLVQSHFVWDNELKTTIHECDQCHQGLIYNDIFHPKKIQVPGLRTPTKNRI